MRAVETAFAAVSRFNAEAEALPMRFGMALHVGDVLHGNIGVRHRMTWSVLGRAVNEAARLQELTKSENAALIASDAFLRGAPAAMTDAWTPLGARSLRGLSEPIAIHAWRGDAAADAG
jgi:adenylate cyclase